MALYSNMVTGVGNEVLMFAVLTSAEVAQILFKPFNGPVLFQG